MNECCQFFFAFERYETENKILAEESGIVEKLESGDDALKSTGFYEYVGDDGRTILFI